MWSEVALQDDVVAKREVVRCEVEERTVHVQCKFGIINNGGEPKSFAGILQVVLKSSLKLTGERFNKLATSVRLYYPFNDDIQPSHTYKGTGEHSENCDCCLNPTSSPHLEPVAVVIRIVKPEHPGNPVSEPCSKQCSC